MRFLPADGNDGDQNVAESSYGNQGYEERERDKGEVCLDSRWMDDAWSIKLARTF